ncbi:MAG: glycerol-3-phosphate dehydrogenase/oxidase [Ginsengibacter sp.]
MKRAISIQVIRKNETWDVVVIGGGATGLGIALEACTRGYSTLLVEQSDFAKSTSSKSTKLVHGGVRYLAQGNIGLVREASVERGLLYKNAPHLVKNLPFIIPVYSGWDRWKYGLGLKIYDWISGNLSMGPSNFISRAEVLKYMPNIRQTYLKGGVRYYDGQFDDARLALNIAQTIFEQGGYAINYVKAVTINKTDKRVSGITIEDLETGAKYNVKAKAVVNATGVFADEIIRMDQPGATKTLAVSQGVHIVLDKKFLNGNHALMIPKTGDGRVLFLLPWHGKIIAGTTDTNTDKLVLEPVALEKEIDFILETASGYLTVKPVRRDVLSIFAGLRPLAASSKPGHGTKEISRSHKIIVSPSRLFTIIGGKWTTYRKMGEDMVDKIEKELSLKATSSKTAGLPIHGFSKDIMKNDPLYFYGSDQPAIKSLLSEPDDFTISDTLPVSKAQVLWAIREEMARTLEDVLSRRTRCLLLDAGETIRIAPLVANIMASEMNKNEEWIHSQLTAFSNVALNYTGVRDIS